MGMCSLSSAYPSEVFSFHHHLHYYIVFIMSTLLLDTWEIIFLNLAAEAQALEAPRWAVWRHSCLPRTIYQAFSVFPITFPYHISCSEVLVWPSPWDALSFCDIPALTSVQESGWVNAKASEGRFSQAWYQLHPRFQSSCHSLSFSCTSGRCFFSTSSLLMSISQTHNRNKSQIYHFHESPTFYLLHTTQTHKYTHTHIHKHKSTKHIHIQIHTHTYTNTNTWY